MVVFARSPTRRSSVNAAYVAHAMTRPHRASFLRRLILNSSESVRDGHSCDSTKGDRFIPFHDTRRNRRGNRTVRMPHEAWKALCRASRGQDPGRCARDICRVGLMHCRDQEEFYSFTRMTAANIKPPVIQELIHSWCWQSTPSAQRKKYAEILRAYFSRCRADRERRRGYMKPGQPFTRLPG